MRGGTENNVQSETGTIPPMSEGEEERGGGNRQETEQMNLDERGAGGGWGSRGEEKRPWKRGVCLVRDMWALLKNLPWHMFCLTFLV